jgi:hypothetical protein
MNSCISSQMLFLPQVITSKESFKKQNSYRVKKRRIILHSSVDRNNDKTKKYGLIYIEKSLLFLYVHVTVHTNKFLCNTTK